MRLLSLFSGSTSPKSTNITITATHSLRYVYPTGQGGTYITDNHYSVTSMSDFDSVLDRLDLQCGASAELAVGSILERKTNLAELLDFLAKNGVNTNKLAVYPWLNRN